LRSTKNEPYIDAKRVLKDAATSHWPITPPKAAPSVRKGAPSASRNYRGGGGGPSERDYLSISGKRNSLKTLLDSGEKKRKNLREKKKKLSQ